jgi:hypothetical protein
MTVLRLKDGKPDGVILDGVSEPLAQAVASNLNHGAGQSGFVYRVERERIGDSRGSAVSVRS